jgi:hypothetical protein
MASMVVILRGKGPQSTIADISNLNNLESAYYVTLNDTILKDPLNNTSQWRISYSQPNMTARVTSNGAIHLNATIAAESYPQAVNLYRSINFSLAENPVVQISLEASQGIHYGVRITGQDSTGSSFQAWSESSDLQHRPGLGRTENFAINAEVEAYRVNGIFPSAGSSITGLAFYIEATPGQTGMFGLNIYRTAVEATHQYSLNPSSRTLGNMDGIILVVNSTNDLGYGDEQFAQGYIDYYVSGTSDLQYTLYYLHGLAVIGQGYYYSANSVTYNIATFSASNVISYPPFLVGNNTYTIALSPTRGSFLSFQLGGFSIRYVNQAPASATPSGLDPSIIVTYYLVFLFVTPVAIVILTSRLFRSENKQAS